MSSDEPSRRSSRTGLGSTFKWRAALNEAGGRLDSVVSRNLKIPVTEAAELIDFGSVYIGGRLEQNPARELAGGEEITVNFPPNGPVKFYEIDTSRILFRDKNILAYDKEAGIPSQQTPSDAYNNVFAALLRMLALEQPGKTGHPYAALHHRLDRETSGVMLFALQKGVNQAISAAFQNRRVRKEYLAWVEGGPQSDHWTETLDIGKKGGKFVAVQPGRGDKAETDFRVLLRDGERALVQCMPHTGRTHQIRIHLAAKGHRIIGDRAYGAKPEKRLFLHAHRLMLDHPAKRARLTIEAPLPSDWPLPPDLAVPPPPRA